MRNKKKRLIEQTTLGKEELLKDMEAISIELEDNQIFLCFKDELLEQIGRIEEVIPKLYN